MIRKIPEKSEEMNRPRREKTFRKRQDPPGKSAGRKAEIRKTVRRHHFGYGQKAGPDMKAAPARRPSNGIVPGCI